MSEYFVVIPVFNEQKNIRRCLKHTQKFWKHIIVVNDGSTDRTSEILQKFRSVHTVDLQKNQGKGAAMLAGAKKAWSLKADGIVFMDGDLQHNPVHIKEFVRLLKSGCEIVIGERLLKANIPLHRKLGNLVISSGMRLLFGLQMRDIMCGFRGMTKKGFKKIEWSSKGYGVEVEMLVHAARKKVSFTTYIVDTIYHDKYKGFSIRDGLKIMLKIPYWRWIKYETK
jgi:glycosyltransferase involved in cell wall biosynthesis